MRDEIKKVVREKGSYDLCPQCGKRSRFDENKDPLTYYYECPECGCKYEDTKIEFTDSKVRDLPEEITTYYDIVAKAEKLEDLIDYFDYVKELDNEMEWTFIPDSFEGRILRILNMTFNSNIMEELFWYMGENPSKEITIKIHYKNEKENFPCIIEGEENYYLFSPLCEGEEAE